MANHTNRPGHQVCLPTSLTPSTTAIPICKTPTDPLPRSTFSPEGRLFQVEYSLEAIKLGSTAIGVATSEGVILGVEKRVTSTLLETSSVEKIVEIDRHIGCAMSGLQADARSMVEHARVECQSHAFNFNEVLRVESCTQAICDLALRFGESADGEESIMSRPFGVALLIAGYDEDGPSLYHAEPSGTFYRYDAKAIGSGSEGAQAELQNEYHKVSFPSAVMGCLEWTENKVLSVREPDFPCIILI
jgi:20S proteasome subunit alpha 5